MYKTASDKQHDLLRTGSHATKPLATGRADVLPPSADPWAAIFNDIRTQRRIAVENYETAMRQLSDANWALRMASDPKEQRGLLLKRQAILVRRDALARQLGDLRAEIILAARSSLGERFRFAASRMLLHEQYVAINESAREIEVDPDVIKFAGAKVTPHPGSRPSIGKMLERGATEEQLDRARTQMRQQDKRKALRKRLIG